MEIEDWRTQIDTIDRELVGLLNKRAAAARAIGELKRQTSLPIYEPRREAQILQNVSEANEGPLPDAKLHYIFEHVIAVMREFQRSEAPEHGK